MLIAPQSNPDHGDPANWRASFDPGGTAGGTDSLAFTGNPTADADADGLSALLEYVLGSSDTIPGDPAGGLVVGPVSPETAGVEGFLVSFQHNLAADGAPLELHLSTDLVSWSVASAELVSRDQTGTQAFETWRVRAPSGSPRSVWLRLAVTIP